MTAAIEAAMLDATTEGISVIPLRENKRPAVSSWKQYIDTPADLLQVRSWAKTCEGFAMLCGGPQRIQVLDFEALFMEPIYFHAFVAQMNAAGLGELFASWRNGYMVVTPGGGMHVAVHVAGEGTPPGNIKLAMDAEGNTLVETRGHGGYVVAAPSNGRTHPNGGKWLQAYGQFSEMAWATPEEWDAVCSIISKFDAPAAASETPPEALSRPALPGGVSLSRIEHTASWIDGLKLPMMGEVLEHFGWMYHHSDDEHDYWTRPGKPVRDGHSAAVNRNGRIAVFSEKCHPVPVSPNGYRTTFDVIDITGCYQLGHLPNSVDRVELLRRYRQIVPPDHHRPQAVDIPVSDGSWLGDDFWTATEWLERIRETAWGNQTSAEGLLGCVISTYSVSVPSSIRLAPVVSGASSPLNVYATMCGGTGTGKSSILAVSRQLLGVRDDENHRYGFGLRSGEGLPEAVLMEQRKVKGEQPLGPPPYRRGVQVVIDELATLSAQNSRLGDTSLSYFISAWTGGEGAKVGGFKAGGDRSFPADKVRVSAVFGVQPGVASELFADRAEQQGFPGRLLYFGMDHLGPKLVAGEQVPVARLGLPTYNIDRAREIGLIEFPTAIQQQIIDWDYLGKTQGRALIDGHKMLLRMRTAALLALMDSNAHPSSFHWELAGEVEGHSLAQRDRLVAAHRDVAVSKARAAGVYDAEREKARVGHQIEDRARAVAQFVHGEASPVPWRTARDRMNGDVRKQIDAIVTHAVARGWVVIQRDGRKRLLAPGDSKPS
jgi:hypothetical protein